MKIDVVYTWCDGNDEKFKKQKNEIIQKYTQIVNQELCGSVRYEDHDELRYSLRSINKNIPWINHIYNYKQAKTDMVKRKS